VTNPKKLSEVSVKSFCYTALTILLLVSTPKPTFTTTPESGPSANGEFQFTLADGVDRSLKFSARSQTDGSTTGEMTFADPVGIPDSESGVAIPGFFIKASFDCLTVKGAHAVMSGVITESSVGDFLGHRVLLVVEDGGGGLNEANHDKLTWGVYQSPNRSWIPQDAEVPGDQGALLNWIATDFEREDDVGVPARRSEVIGCQTFSLSSYSFVDVRHGQGNIQVRP
jgi:hypothetical protein